MFANYYYYYDLRLHRVSYYFILLGGSTQPSINIQDLDLNALLAEEKTEDSLKTSTSKL